MLEAFDVIRLVEKLPLKICAIATWDDWFIVSTVSSKSEAHLLVYKVIQVNDFDHIYEAKLERTLKKFTTKPVTHLAVVPEHDFLFALTNDGEIHCANLLSYQMITDVLPRIRSCSCFAVDWHKLKSYERTLRICIASRKKLLIYNFTGHKFNLTAELSVIDIPRLISWIGNTVFICIKKDLYCMTLDGSIKELFQIGQNRTEPCLLPIQRKDKQEMLVLVDEKQITLDQEGKPTQPSALMWSDLPMCIERVHPYIIGMLPRSIEVRALEQKIQVQSIKMTELMKDNAKFIVHDEMTLVASSTQVYKLEPKAYDKQVQQLVQQRQFELALEIAELIQENESEKKTRREEIVRRYAFHLFTQHNFEESLRHYLDIKEDPVNVIGLYPHLLPGDLRQALRHPLPTAPPTLTGEDLKKAMEFLIKYLTQMRYLEQQNLQQTVQNDDNVIKKLEARLQLIDTTLLKCYIKTNNNTLIGSLVRLPDNYLHLVESERVLRNEEKFQELVQLFRTKSQHKKALELLSQFHHKGPSGPLSGVWPTIDYLQNLGRSNITLILEYSKWVLKKCPEDGIKIFTEEIGEVESLPRDKVLKHLIECAPDSDLKTQYLEHIIHRWSDKTPEFHNKLILIYKKDVEPRLKKYLEDLKGRPRAKAGEEPNELGFVRSKLLNFLQSSDCYEPESLISYFPAHDLFEERALLLGRLGRHDVALAMYAHVIKDPKMAEDYCRRMYNPDKEESKEVYLSLIHVYLHPPKLSELGIHIQKGQSDQPDRDINTAMSILASYHEKIDTAKVMEMLPDDTTIQDIRKFLTMLLEENTVIKRRVQISRNLYLAEHLQVQKNRIKEGAPHFIIDDLTTCNICGKKLGTSAFARYVNGELVHLYCYQKEMEKQDTENEYTNY